MKLADLKLSLLPFPQSWDPAARKLTLRVLLLPATDPTQPAGPVPAFATQAWKLRVTLRPDPESLSLGNIAADHAETKDVVPPAGAPGLYEALRKAFKVSSPVVTTALQKARLDAIASLRVRKELPPSYRQAVGGAAASDHASTGHDFGCELRDAAPPPTPDPKPPQSLTWGAVISFALKQPLLARALGLIHDVTLTVSPVFAATFSTGGWLKVELDPSGPVDPKVPWLGVYAARLPALMSVTPPQGFQRLFAPVLFPVSGTAPAFDAAFGEAARYQDGFAKIVHAAQAVDADAASSGHSVLTPATDVGIDLGWDDEQILAWANRQFDAMRTRLDASATLHCPLGVCGYRVDVRDADVPDASWESLCEVFSINASGAPGPLTFPPGAPAFQEVFKGELSIDTVPSKRRNSTSNRVWLPRYFARWQGKSLVVEDPVMLKLTGTIPKDANGVPLELKKPSYAAPSLKTKLRYGRTYEFRVRLVDLTGGGPNPADSLPDAAPSRVARIRFVRHIAPKALRGHTEGVFPPAGSAALPSLTHLHLRRPLLGYPELVFAGVGGGNVIRDLVEDVAAARAEGRSVGVPDPHVTGIHIQVQVRLPAHDLGPAGGQLSEGGFVTLYEHTFSPAARDTERVIPIQYVDVPNLAEFAVPGAGAKTLPLPANRDVRLRVRAVCDDSDKIFADPQLRFGLVSDFMTRGFAAEQKPVFTLPIEVNPISGILLQPAEDLTQRLAQQLKLVQHGLRFTGRAGERVIFGASAVLRHQVESEGAALTFANRSDLLGHWLVPLQFVLARDWTWDGLVPQGLRVERARVGTNDWVEIGVLNVPFTIAGSARQNGESEDKVRRSHTRLIFFDAVDPNPEADKFPATPHFRWRVKPTYKQGVAAGATPVEFQPLLLPVAVPPRQVPRIVSAGIAMSPYRYDENGYTYTEHRRKALWLEFEEPIADPQDGLFARVLAYGPDPLLATQISHLLRPHDNTPHPGGEKTPFEMAVDHLPQPPPFPDLPVPPEPMRVILPGQSADQAGLDAMMPMKPALMRVTENVRHYLVPLPPGVPEDAAELFGFWTYEIRVGHEKVWSTAQARFGRPLVVTGVQHPPPALSCTPFRQPAKVLFGGRVEPGRIRVTAPYAQTVFGGQTQTSLLYGDPQTTVWVYLYAQVAQLDGKARRNVLIAQAPAVAVVSKAAVEPNQILGQAEFMEADVRDELRKFGLPDDTSLSVLAVEFLPGGGGREWISDFKFVEHSAAVTGRAPDPGPNPLGNWPHEDSRRILRCSPLTPVPPAC